MFPFTTICFSLAFSVPFHIYKIFVASFICKVAYDYESSFRENNFLIGFQWKFLNTKILAASQLLIMSRLGGYNVTI